MSKYAGSGWIAEHDYGKAMSLLGVAVADLLGDVFEGIYHLNKKALSKVRWENPHQVEIVVDSHSFSTVDHNTLTRLVVLAHDRAMRLSIRGVAPDYLRLVFHQRTREGDLYHSCPSLEEHVALIRKRFGLPIPPAINWIPVTERMPTPDTPVLAISRLKYPPNPQFWSRSIWIPRHFKEEPFPDPDIEWDWDEEGNHTYVPEGWYEHCVEKGEYQSFYGIAGTVTHWAEIDLPPLEPAHDAL